MSFSYSRFNNKQLICFLQIYLNIPLLILFKPAVISGTTVLDKDPYLRRNLRVIRQITSWNSWESPQQPANFPFNALNNNNNQDSNLRRRQFPSSDTIYFEDEFNSILGQAQQSNTTPTLISTPKAAYPGMATTQSACEDRCQTTPEYNPVCGDDNRSYFSMNRLKCAQRCGRSVKVKHIGACPMKTN